MDLECIFRHREDRIEMIDFVITRVNFTSDASKNINRNTQNIRSDEFSRENQEKKLGIH